MDAVLESLQTKHKHVQLTDNKNSAQKRQLNDLIVIKFYLFLSLIWTESTFVTLQAHKVTLFLSCLDFQICQQKSNRF